MNATSKIRTLLASLLLCSQLALGEQINYPGKPELKRYADEYYGVSIDFPASWVTEAPERNEIWLSQGQVRNISGICFVRVSEVEGLHLVKPAEYFAQTDEAKFQKITSLSMPDIKVHLFDMAYLSDRPSRRIVYSGTDSGIKTGNVIYQTLDGDRIFTVGCLSEVGKFNLIYNDFEAVIASFYIEER